MAMAAAARVRAAAATARAAAATAAARQKAVPTEGRSRCSRFRLDKNYTKRRGRRRRTTRLRRSCTSPCMHRRFVAAEGAATARAAAAMATAARARARAAVAAAVSECEASACAASASVASASVACADDDHEKGIIDAFHVPRLKLVEASGRAAAWWCCSLWTWSAAQGAGLELAHARWSERADGLRIWAAAAKVRVAVARVSAAAAARVRQRKKSRPTCRCLSPSQCRHNPRFRRCLALRGSN